MSATTSTRTMAGMMMGRRSAMRAETWRAIVLPIVAVALALALWWAATVAFAIPAYVLPGPGLVVDVLLNNLPFLLQQTGVTLFETVIGFLIAIAIGIPLAMGIARFRTMEQMLYPLLLAVNSVPKVAIAPILLVWMGFGLTPKIVMVVLLCFFPIVLSTVAGLRSTPSDLVELTKSLSAKPFQQFSKVRFWWALPQIFVGFKNAITLAVIGAVIGEFVGSSSGLGFVIVQSGASANMALAFAAILLLAVISIALFYILVLIEKRLLPWAEENR